METLSTELRLQLERTVVEARDVSEAGARGALEALAVPHHELHGHMSGEQRKLRNRLRAHARHLGDRVDARSGAHAIDHLVHECACEHWHGMLIARFLAENHLLIEPEMEVAITLDECEELAKEEGIDKWTLAARFAHRMLPQVFRPDHPVFEVQLAREYRLKLEGLVEGLPAEMFKASVKRGEGGAEGRLAAALDLQKRLVAILEGEPPFDLFVRWKPIEEQSIGWEPDINDGVRLNVRPFMAQDLPDGKRGAGILRAKPHIHWKKDRGKEPLRDRAQFPWFWKNGKFTGERVNDVHLRIAEKRAARAERRADTDD